MKREKWARQRGLVGGLWGTAGVGKEELAKVELDEEDLTTDRLIERAARQRPGQEKPVLWDSHRRREERRREIEENNRRIKREREARVEEEERRRG